MNTTIDLSTLFDWTPESMLEVVFDEPDDFLKIKESLTRIGIASRSKNKLTQTAHLLHKRGKYYIVHFFELFALDGKEIHMTHNDVLRRDAIATLLEDWGLLRIVDSRHRVPREILKRVMSEIAVIRYDEKADWELIAKYTISGGKKKVDSKQLSNAA